MTKTIVRSMVMALAGISLLAGSAMATLTHYDVAGGPNDNPTSSVTLSNVSTFGWTSVSASLVAGLDDVVFDLDENESYTFDFITLSLDGTGVGTFDIAASLAFETPEITSDASSSAWYMTQSIFGTYSAGNLTWNENSPESFIINGDLITIDFLDLTGCAPGQDFTITATVTNNGAAPVPEPATMLLFGTGLAGLAGISRKKTKKNA